LYLEWAPDNSFTTTASKTKAIKSNAIKKSTNLEEVKDELTIKI